MATKQTTEPAPSKFKLAIMTDDEVFKTGQPDKFTGVILSILAGPVKAKDKDTYYGSVGVRILPDEDSGYPEFTKHYLAGYFSPNGGVPSRDGSSPAGGSDSLYFALGSGKAHIDEKEDAPVLLGVAGEYDRHFNPDSPYVGPYWLGNMVKNKGFHLFRNHLNESDEKKLADQNGSLNWAVGMHCRFDLVPQEAQEDKKTPTGSEKAQQEGEKKEPFKILLPTIVLGRVDVKTLSNRAGSVGAPGSSKANGSVDQDELKAEIIPHIMEILAKGPAKKGNLMAKIPPKFSKEKKAYVSAWLQDDDNLSDIPGTLYDAYKGEGDDKNANYSTLELEA